MSLEERKRKMREAGIPMPITQLPISEGSTNAIPVTAQNADKHARLQALKSGANKNQVQSLVKATSAQQSFQGIPEVKQKPRPQGHSGQQGQAPVHKVPLQSNFGPAVKVSNEFSAMEAMYGGGSDAPSYNPRPQQVAQPMNTTTQPELSVQQDGYGPVFDPAKLLAKKRQQMQNNQAQQP
ncbi:MAG: hypothetical protein AABY15_03415, partial [Nanoarchaeota archaeon]